MLCPVTVFVPKVITGSQDWSLPTDWRLASPLCKKAIQLVLEVAANATATSSIAKSADVVWAIRLIADTPSQLRPSEMEQLADYGILALRQQQKLNRMPLKAGRLILGFASGGVSELAGLVVQPVVRKVSEHLEEQFVAKEGAHHMVLQTVWEMYLDELLDAQWGSQDLINSDSDLATDLKGLVAWRCFARDWSVVIPDVVDETQFLKVVQEFKREFTSVQNSPVDLVNLWISSPFDSPIADHHKMQKKLEKGNLPAQIVETLSWYLEREEATLRHVRALAQRLGWTSKELLSAGTRSADATFSDGTW
jgi:hypothetical protein